MQAISPTFARALIAASAAIALLIGAFHLQAVFFGEKLRPRDPGVEARMRGVSPNVTNRITLWDAWIAFNAIQSLGLILFGVLYGYLAVFRYEILKQAYPLLFVGGVFMAGVFAVSARYLPGPPARAFGASLVLYLIGAAAAAFG